MRIGCISTEPELTALAPEWTRLWQQVPHASPFQSPAWLLAWWRHFGTGAPRVMTVRSGDALAAVLPLYLLDEASRPKLLPLGIGLSDYIDALIDPACAGGADLLLGAVADLPGWDECHLPDLPPGAALGRARCPPGLRDAISAAVPCPVLPLPATGVGLDGAGLDTVIPKKTLRDARQAARRSAAVGGATIEAAASDTLPGMLDDLYRLHAARWQTRGAPGVLADPAVRAFHRDAARALLTRGMLRLYRLHIADRAAAVYYGFASSGRSYAYIGGFDPELPRLSPGAQIILHAIREAVAEGCAEFHFLRGDESYKYSWGASARWNSARTLTRR
jgi:CelD/BcsL family acetyltransferase involved in cellulose biosynthesis